MSRQNKARSLRLESLEPREVPAIVGALDPSFGTAGKINVAGVPYFGVALQTDGKVVAVGSQGGDFLVARFNPDGSLDTAFNGGGTKKIDFGGATDTGNDVAIQPDGKIVVVGSTDAVAANGLDFAVARLNADGTLDTTFNTTGKLTVDFLALADTANSVALASNGDIYVVGTATQAAGDTAFGVARVSGTNGALITAFGNNGKQFIDFGGTADSGNGIDIAQDGKVIVVGTTNAVAANGTDFAIARFDPTTGMLDATFNGTGQTTVNFGAAANDGANDVNVLADGSMVVAGFTNIVGAQFDAGVARLSAAGVLDPTFDGDGLANIDFGGAADSANRVGVLANGKVVLVGNNDADAVVARLNPNGALDTSFNGSGKTAIDFGGVDSGQSGVITPQGRIVITGTSGAGANGFLARLTGTVEKGQELATGGSLNGAASVFLPDATGKLATTAAFTAAPFSGFTGNVRVALGDVNGDGVDDLAVVTGPGKAPVQFAVISGADQKTVLIAPTDPFGNASFNGGGFVSVGDLDNDGRAEVVITPDQGGGPNVVIYSLVGTTATVRKAFLGIDDPNFRGGARTAIGDFNGDGVQDLAVAAGFLGGPRVALFDGKTVFGTPTRLINDFFAFTGSDVNNLRNGVFIAAGDVNGDGFADLIAGGGPGGGPRILTISGKVLLGTGAGTGVDAAQATPLQNFFVAGNESDRGGVRLAAVDLDGDNKVDVVAGSGEGVPSKVRTYLGKNITTSAEPTTFQDIDPYAATLAGGVFVG
jgi:uncharacterized delta-60 repeat protein